MWRHRSLIYPTVSFLLLAIGTTLAVGYTVNFAILEDVLQERMTQQARRISEGVLQALSLRVQRLERFKESWMANADWSREAESDRRLVGKESDKAPEAWWRHLSGLLPLWGVDFVWLLDAEGRVTHRMPEDFGRGAPLPDRWGDPTPGSSKAWWRLVPVGGAWQLMLFATLKEGDQARVVVFGQGLSRVIAQIHRENPGHPFLLIDAEGKILSGSTEAMGGAWYDPKMAALVIATRNPQMDFDRSLPANLYYTPMPLWDHPFALAVSVSLDEVREVLANSRQRLIFSIGFMILVLFGLGVAMERTLLRPLRRLREKAALMVQACSGREQGIHLDPREHGNEIVMLERAMEEASIKLYLHVDQLVNTKHLLEGLSLKDPITTLGNRRMLDEFLSRTLGQCKRKERQVAVILLAPDPPLDRIAPASLTAREQDEVRRQLADRLRGHLRGEDLAFRINRDEYVAFLPECGDEEQVLALIHRLHGFVAGSYPLEDGREVVVGIRMGVAVFPGAGEHVEILLDHARTALAQTREGGRYPYAIYNFPQATREEE